MLWYFVVLLVGVVIGVAIMYYAYRKTIEELKKIKEALSGGINLDTLSRVKTIINGIVKNQ